MTCKIWAHNPGSQGAKLLSRALGIQRILHNGSRWRQGPGDRVINWGSGSALSFQGVINDPRRVAISANKLSFFQMDTGARLPRWTTDRDFSRQNFRTVVARRVLNGHSGSGIVICGGETGVDIPVAPLYTEYVKKTAEYRVHIMNGEVIDVQKKIRDPNREPTNWHVRSHDNGFIYVRDGVREGCPPDVLTQSQLAFDASGLDFGAVDVVWNQHVGLAYVLEINTAPGLTGETVNSYSRAFRRIYGV